MIQLYKKGIFMEDKKITEEVMALFTKDLNRKLIFHGIAVIIGMICVFVSVMSENIHPTMTTIFSFATMIFLISGTVRLAIYMIIWKYNKD